MAPGLEDEILLAKLSGLWELPLGLLRPFCSRLLSPLIPALIVHFFPLMHLVLFRMPSGAWGSQPTHLPSPSVHLQNFCPPFRTQSHCAAYEDVSLPCKPRRDSVL